MRKREIIYQLKKYYTFKHIGEVLEISKQAVYELYWKHWKTIKDIDLKTCDLCERLKKDVDWHLKMKLCEECWETVKSKRRKEFRQKFLKRSDREFRQRKKEIKQNEKERSGIK